PPPGRNPMAAAGRARRIEEPDLAELGSPPNAQTVVHDCIRETLLVEPDARESMSPHESDQRVESRLLETRTREQRDVEASRELFARDTPRQPHPLTLVFEACRRHRVADVELPDRGIDRRGRGDHTSL